MLIRRARAWPMSWRGEIGDIPVTDVRITGDRITECAPLLRPLPGEEVLDAAGCALLPGLHDHHIHLRALAAAHAAGIQAGPPEVRTADDLRTRLRQASASSPPGAWLRCVAYHECVAGPLDRWVLDQIVPERPVRVQHHSGTLWMVNSAAARRLGLDSCDLPGVERDGDGRPTGRLVRMDAWLAGQVPATQPDLGAVSAEAAALGVTGFTDATPGATLDDVAALARAAADGTIVQRLHVMAPAEAALPADTSRPAGAAITLGPVKILLEDERLPALHELAGRVQAAHAAGKPVAVHCVTRIQLVLTLAALDAAGRHPGDRVEHGALIPAQTIADLRGLTVVTQPHLPAERGQQYERDVAAADLPDLWRLRTLLDAGVAVAGGTDAPFGGADPWHVMRAAAGQLASLRPDEAISPAQAIGLFLGEPAAPATPRLVAPGHPADLVLLRCQLAEAASSLASDLVAATVTGGELVYERAGSGALAPGDAGCLVRNSVSCAMLATREASAV